YTKCHNECQHGKKSIATTAKRTGKNKRIIGQNQAYQKAKYVYKSYPTRQPGLYFAGFHDHCRHLLFLIFQYLIQNTRLHSASLITCNKLLRTTPKTLGAMKECSS